MIFQKSLTSTHQSRRVRIATVRVGYAKTTQRFPGETETDAAAVLECPACATRCITMVTQNIELESPNEREGRAMTSSLYWWPVPINSGECLPDRLKFVLRVRHGDPVQITLGHGDLSYLTGLRDAGVDGARELIGAIEKYDEIQVEEKY